LFWLAFAVLLFVLLTVRDPIHDPQLRDAGVENATIVPDLWLPVFKFNGSTLLAIKGSDDLRVLTFGILPAVVNDNPNPVAAGGSAGAPARVSLGWFALFMVLVEGFLGLRYADKDEKLVRPLVRAAGIFLVICRSTGTSRSGTGCCTACSRPAPTCSTTPTPSSAWRASTSRWW